MARRGLARGVAVVVAGLLIPLGSGAAVAATTTPSPTASPTPTTTTVVPPTPSTPTSPMVTPTPTRTPTPTSPTSSPATSPTATPSPSAPPPPEPGAETALTPEQVRQQVAAAAVLRAQLGVSNARLDAVLQTMTGISAQVSAALERQRTADQAASAAALTATPQLSRLINLHVQVLQGQSDLGRWAREAYATGGVLAEYQGWVTAFSGGSTADVAHDLALLQHVGVVSSTTLTQLQGASAQQQVVARTSAVAAARSRDAQTAARKARERASALLLEQRQMLATLQTGQLETVDRAQQASQRLGLSSSAAAQAAQAQLTAVLAARAAGRPVPLDPNDCQGLDTRPYANGEIPTAALCPLWGAPDKTLRADAAAAFRDLSKAFAAEFGRPICVTDAYRTRSEQVSVFATKPGLAAVPGTSNHGLGLATDLCGGIQSFATIEHVWMLTHAGLFGWFHPSWAEPTGSKPEPWHWEFAG